MRFLDRIKPKYLVSWHQPLIGVDSYGVKDRKPDASPLPGS